jgi:DNA helicase HerA-like ATPase
MNKDAEIIGIYGGRGQGKSTYTKALLKKYQRVVVFDPMREYAAISGFNKASNLHEVLTMVKRGKRVRYRIAYTPETTDLPLALHELCKLLFAIQRPYFDGKSKLDCLLVVEELNMTAPSHNLPKGREGFKASVLQGRHYGIEIIGITQRPKLVAPYFRDNAGKEIIFKLACPDSISYVEKKMIDKKYHGKIYSLQPHHYIKIDGFDLSTGKNILKK